MQVTVGVDIIEVERIKSSIEELGEKFLNRVFTEKEILYCSSKKKMEYQHYAARFAAKEATFKAISSLLEDKYSISWKNIQTINEESGKPKLEFISITKEVEQEIKKIRSIDISLSHLEEYAIANVTMLID